MLILTIRTDKPKAEIGLYEDEIKIQYKTWQAHRKLAETIHINIKDLLDTSAKQLGDIEGIVIYKGPGSFTGLRIGISVANALSQSLSIPVIGGEYEEWLKQGIKRITSNENDKLVTPEYGAPVHITQPKK